MMEESGTMISRMEEMQNVPMELAGIGCVRCGLRCE